MLVKQICINGDNEKESVRMLSPRGERLGIQNKVTFLKLVSKSYRRLKKIERGTANHPQSALTQGIRNSKEIERSPAKIQSKQ